MAPPKAIPKLAPQALDESALPLYSGNMMESRATKAIIDREVQSPSRMRHITQERKNKAL